MKTIARRLILASPIFLLVFALALPVFTIDAHAQALISQPTMAALRAVPVSGITANAEAHVADYYGTGYGCPIWYAWNAADKRADDGGGVINPAGNAGAGRWNIQLQPSSPIHSCQYGVKIDSPIRSASVVTDNTVQLQRMINWAYTYGSNEVYLDAKKGFCIGHSKTLTPNEGEVFRGAGQQQTTGRNPGNTCLAFYGTSGPAILNQTPYPGFGTTQYEGPKFYNFGIYVSINNASLTPTGCIQINSNAGGFTNDNASQQPVLHFVAENISCIMAYGHPGQTGIYCAKCADGRVTSPDIQFGQYGIVFDGSDNMEINGSCRISEPYSGMVRFLSEGGTAQFGNNDRIRGCQFLSFAPIKQAVDSFIYTTAISDSIEDVFFEGPPPPGGSLASQIHIAGGISHFIKNNYMSGGPYGGPAAPWLHVSANILSLTAINNNVPALQSYPIFSGNRYWYNSSVTSSWVHYGNGQAGDALWPANTMPLNQQMGVNAIVLYTPSTPGLVYDGAGISQSTHNNFFVLSNGSSSSGYLQWANGYPASMPWTGTGINVQLLAYQSKGPGAVTCQLMDNGSLVGSPITNRIQTGTVNKITYNFNQTISTNGGVRCWSGANGAYIGEVRVF